MVFKENEKLTPLKVSIFMKYLLTTHVVQILTSLWNVNICCKRLILLHNTKIILPVMSSRNVTKCKDRNFKKNGNIRRSFYFEVLCFPEDLSIFT